MKLFFFSSSFFFLPLLFFFFFFFFFNSVAAQKTVPSTCDSTTKLRTISGQVDSSYNSQNIIKIPQVDAGCTIILERCTDVLYIEIGAASSTVSKWGDNSKLIIRDVVFRPQTGGSVSTNAISLLGVHETEMYEIHLLGLSRKLDITQAEGPSTRVYSLLDVGASSFTCAKSFIMRDCSMSGFVSAAPGMHPSTWPPVEVFVLALSNSQVKIENFEFTGNSVELGRDNNDEEVSLKSLVVRLIWGSKIVFPARDDTGGSNHIRVADNRIALRCPVKPTEKLTLSTVNVPGLGESNLRSFVVSIENNTISAAEVETKSTCRFYVLQLSAKPSFVTAIHVVHNEVTLAGSHTCLEEASYIALLQLRGSSSLNRLNLVGKPAVFNLSHNAVGGSAELGEAPLVNSDAEIHFACFFSRALPLQYDDGFALWQLDGNSFRHLRTNTSFRSEPSWTIFLPHFAVFAIDGRGASTTPQVYSYLLQLRGNVFRDLSIVNVRGAGNFVAVCMWCSGRVETDVDTSTFVPSLAPPAGIVGSWFGITIEENRIERVRIVSYQTDQNIWLCLFDVRAASGGTQIVERWSELVVAGNSIKSFSVEVRNQGLRIPFVCIARLSTRNLAVLANFSNNFMGGTSPSNPSSLTAPGTNFRLTLIRTESSVTMLGSGKGIFIIGNEIRHVVLNATGGAAKANIVYMMMRKTVPAFLLWNNSVDVLMMHGTASSWVSEVTLLDCSALDLNNGYEAGKDHNLLTPRRFSAVRNSVRLSGGTFPAAGVDVLVMRVNLRSVDHVEILDNHATIAGSASVAVRFDDTFRAMVVFCRQAVEIGDDAPPVDSSRSFVAIGNTVSLGAGHVGGTVDFEDTGRQELTAMVLAFDEIGEKSFGRAFSFVVVSSNEVVVDSSSRLGHSGNGRRTDVAFGVFSTLGIIFPGQGVALPDQMRVADLLRNLTRRHGEAYILQQPCFAPLRLHADTLLTRSIVFFDNEISIRSGSTIHPREDEAGGGSAVRGGVQLSMLVLRSRTRRAADRPVENCKGMFAFGNSINVGGDVASGGGSGLNQLVVISVDSDTSRGDPEFASFSVVNSSVRVTGRWLINGSDLLHAAVAQIGNPMGSTATKLSPGLTLFEFERCAVNLSGPVVIAGGDPGGAGDAFILPLGALRATIVGMTRSPLTDAFLTGPARFVDLAVHFGGFHFLDGTYIENYPGRAAHVTGLAAVASVTAFLTLNFDVRAVPAGGNLTFRGINVSAAGPYSTATLMETPRRVRGFTTLQLSSVTICSNVSESKVMDVIPFITAGFSFETGFGEFLFVSAVLEDINCVATSAPPPNASLSCITAENFRFLRPFPVRNVVLEVDAASSSSDDGGAESPWPDDTSSSLSAVTFTTDLTIIEQLTQEQHNEDDESTPLDIGSCAVAVKLAGSKTMRARTLQVVSFLGRVDVPKGRLVVRDNTVSVNSARVSAASMSVVRFAAGAAFGRQGQLQIANNTVALGEDTFLYYPAEASSSSNFSMGIFDFTSSDGARPPAFTNITGIAITRNKLELRAKVERKLGSVEMSLLKSAESAALKNSTFSPSAAGQQHSASGGGGGVDMSENTITFLPKILPSFDVGAADISGLTMPSALFNRLVLPGRRDLVSVLDNTIQTVSTLAAPSYDAAAQRRSAAVQNTAQELFCSVSLLRHTSGGEGLPAEPLNLKPAGVVLIEGNTLNITAIIGAEGGGGARCFSSLLELDQHVLASGNWSIVGNKIQRSSSSSGRINTGHDSLPPVAAAFVRAQRQAFSKNAAHFFLENNTLIANSRIIFDPDSAAQQQQVDSNFSFFDIRCNDGPRGVENALMQNTDGIFNKIFSRRCPRTKSASLSLTRNATLTGDETSTNNASASRSLSRGFRGGTDSRTGDTVTQVSPNITSSPSHSKSLESTQTPDSPLIKTFFAQQPVVAGVFSMASLLSATGTNGGALARQRKLLRMSQGCSIEGGRREKPDGASSPMQLAIDEEDAEFMYLRGVAVGVPLFLLTFALVFFALAWLAAKAKGVKYSKGMRMLRLPGMVMLPAAVLAPEVASAVGTLAFFSSYRPSDILSMLVGVLFGMLLPFWYCASKAQHVVNEANKGVRQAEGDERDAEADLPTQFLEDIPECDRPLIWCPTDAELEAQIESRRQLIAECDKKIAMLEAAQAGLDDGVAEIPVDADSAIAAEDGRERRKKKKNRDDNSCSSSSTDEESDDEEDDGFVVKPWLVRFKSYMMDGVSQRWADTRFIQFHGILWEPSRILHFCTLDFGMSLVLGAVSGTVDGDTDAARCVTVSIMAIVLTALYFLLLFVVQIRGFPAWLTRFDTMCVWGNCLLSLPTSVLSFLQHSHEQSKNEAKAIAAYLASKADGSDAAAASAAGEAATASSVDYEAGLEALGYLSAALGFFALIALVDVLLLFREGAMELAEAWCPAEKKKKKKKKTKKNHESEEGAAVAEKKAAARKKPRRHHHHHSTTDVADDSRDHADETAGAAPKARGKFVTKRRPVNRNAAGAARTAVSDVEGEEETPMLEMPMLMSPKNRNRADVAEIPSAAAAVRSDLI